MKLSAVIVSLLLTGTGLAEPAPQDEAVPPRKTMSVDVPASARMAQTVILRVTVGSLPRGSRVTVSSPGGQILGVIAPFGAAASKSGGMHTLPIPHELLAASKLSLVFILEQPGISKPTAPSQTQVKNAEVVVEQ